VPHPCQNASAGGSSPAAKWPRQSLLPPSGVPSLVRQTGELRAVSIYRKLGVSNRSQAVTQSRKLGLLEA
jgi:hypothetical protein